MANFSFGGNSPAKPAFGLNTSGFNFGGTTTTTTASTSGFFSTPTTTSAPATGFGGFGTTTNSFNLGKPAAQPANLSFGATTTLGTANPAQPPAFDFGKSGTSFSTPSLGTGGLFGSTTTAATVTTTQPQSIGLGGVDLNATKPKAVEGKNENAKVKESQVPQEIVLLADNLKSHIKQQKEISSDIAKSSTRKLFGVQNEIQNLSYSLSDISNLIDNNYAAVKSLRAETAEAIQYADMAQRTHDTHANLQYENTAPIQYFMNLVQKYENEIIKLRGQVELTEKHMKSLTNPQKLSAEDLKRGITQIHESFISLASRVLDVHQKVEDQKEQYLNLRKYLLHDKTNVFDEVETSTSKTSLAKVISGPTPFSTITGINLGITPTNTGKDSWLSNSNTATGLNIRQTFGTESNLLGSATGFTGGDAFNLQKPPFGMKRTKH